MKTDQYGDPIPSDLVLLMSPSELSIEEIKLVLDARWYEVKDFLMVSAEAVAGQDALYSPIDAGINLEDPGVEVMYVAESLKRWSYEDGFYHA